MNVYLVKMRATRVAKVAYDSQAKVPQSKSDQQDSFINVHTNI